MTAFIGFPQDGHAFSADEVGRALAGLVRRDPDGTPREGVLGDGPTLTAVPAAWKVQVGPFTHVEDVSGAVVFSGLSAAEQVDITPASGIPAGQTRIDLVCWDTATPELVVVEGTPGTSPSEPSTGGLSAIVRVIVKSGDGAVAQGQVSPAFKQTWLLTEQRLVDACRVSARSVAANGFTDVPVSFTTAFTSAPSVVPGVFASGSVRSVGAYALDVSKTGFVMRLDSSSSLARSFGASWTATQA